jgi:uncharacterized membrane protein YgcG
MRCLILSSKFFGWGVITLLVTFASLALGRSTYSLEVPPPKGYISDLARLLPRDYAADLDDRLRRFEQHADHKILILTVTSLEGEDIKSFSQKLFTDWRLEVPSKILVLVIVKNERKVLIEGSPILEQILNDLTTTRRVEYTVVSYLDGYKPEVGIEHALESLVARLNTGHLLELPAKQTAFWNVGGSGPMIVAMVLSPILAFALGLLLGVSFPFAKLPLCVRLVFCGVAAIIVALGVGVIVSVFDQLSSGLWIFIATSGFVTGALGSINEFWSSGRISEKKEDERLKTPYIGGF